MTVTAAAVALGVIMGQRVAGKHVANQRGNAFVNHSGERGYGFGIIALVIVYNQLYLLAVDAAGFVYLFEIQFRAVAHAQSVYGVFTGMRPQQANLYGIAAAGIVGSIVVAAGRAAREHYRGHNDRHHHCKNPVPNSYHPI